MLGWLTVNETVRVKVDSEDTVEVLKKMIAAQMGTDWQKIVLKKWWLTPSYVHTWRSTLIRSQVHNFQESYHTR